MPEDEIFNLPEPMLEAAPQTPQKPSFMSEAAAFVWETVKVVVLALAIILPIRYYLVQPFFVKGASMEPSFEDGDYILINELSYRLHVPDRGVLREAGQQIPQEFQWGVPPQERNPTRPNG